MGREWKGNQKRERWKERERKGGEDPALPIKSRSRAPVGAFLLRNHLNCVGRGVELSHIVFQPFDGQPIQRHVAALRQQEASRLRFNRCQILWLKCTKLNFGWVSAPIQTRSVQRSQTPLELDFGRENRAANGRNEWEAEVLKGNGETRRGNFLMPPRPMPPIRRQECCTVSY